jgi:hypothetical protein
MRAANTDMEFPRGKIRESLEDGFQLCQLLIVVMIPIRSVKIS